MDAELKNLQIDRNKRRSAEPSKWATRWIIGGVLILLLLGGWRFAAEKFNPTPVVLPRNASVASGCDSEIVSGSSLPYSFSPKALADAICSMIAWVDILTEGTAILSLAVKSLMVLTSGSRVTR